MKNNSLFVISFLVLNSFNGFAIADDSSPNLKLTYELSSASAAKAKPVAKKPVAKAPVAKKPVAKKPGAKKPVAAEPIKVKPEVIEPIKTKPTETVAENKKEETPAIVIAPPKPVEVIKVDEFPMNEIIKMENDKEVVLNSFDKKEKERILVKFDAVKDKQKFRTIFFKVMHTYLNSTDAKCDSSMISELIYQLSKNGIMKDEAEMKDVFMFLRATNVIDDVMFDILDGLSVDYFALGKTDLKLKPTENPFKDYDKKAKDYDLALFFKEFKTVPDEKNKCVYKEYSRLQAAVGERKDNLKTRNKILKDLAYKAYKDGAVDLVSYNVLKFLSTSSTLNKRTIWLGDYVNTIITAKNKMVPKNYKYKVVNIEDENKYTSEKKSRFSKITLRKLLYQKYDANQIILLAQVMKKASQRMGVDPDTMTSAPYILQEFKDLSEGDGENYVQRIELDTQSQFNLARRLLRRDIVKLQMMESFLAQKITYDDLVTASVETGYISLDDIDYVVKYDDLWNPEITQNEKLMNMGFMIAGYATFFLPPPWNVTGALALSIAEGVIDSKNVKGVDNDNANTFIE